MAQQYFRWVPRVYMYNNTIGSVVVLVMCMIWEVICMLLARDSVVGISIPSSILLPASLFTRSVIHHPATNSLVTLLARLLMMLYYREGPEISLRHTERQIPVSIHATQQTPSEIPIEHLYDRPVMKWQLIAHKVFLRYPGVTWSHGLRNRYLTWRKL